MGRRMGTNGFFDGVLFGLLAGLLAGGLVSAICMLSGCAGKHTREPAQKADLYRYRPEKTATLAEPAQIDCTPATVVWPNGRQKRSYPDGCTCREAALQGHLTTNGPQDTQLRAEMIEWYEENVGRYWHLIAENWLQCGRKSGVENGDLNGDGIVNYVDFCLYERMKRKE